MGEKRDPLQERADGEQDLYDVATWERRSVLDRAAVRIYRLLGRVSIYLVIGLALVLLVAQLAASGYAVARNPALGVLTLLSAVPALALAAFLWRADPTVREPLGPLAVTFLLSVLFASFAAVLNTIFRIPFALVPVVGVVLYFFLVVGPIEETVKLLAVRLYAYRGDAFRTVVDGAVYGAVAGLGFATIENSLYITREFLAASSAGGMGQQLQMAAGTATQRAFVGPGHVIYSGFAGYYLGLAKFNPDDAGPIVVKGLLTAALIHATYNTLVGLLGLPFVGLLAFIAVYDGFFGYLLYRKLARYRKAYSRANGGQPPRHSEVVTED